jgi:RND superfamily putative drug exporter
MTMESQIMHNPPLARLGTWAHANRMAVIVAWAVFAIGLGIFAPKLEHALSGAMWEVDGSDSLAARDVIAANSAGSSQSAAVVAGRHLAADDPARRMSPRRQPQSRKSRPGPAMAQPAPTARR